MTQAAIADEMGDLLFAVVNLVRKNKLDAETGAGGGDGKIHHALSRLERELQAQGRQLGEVDLAAMDEIWNRVKRG